MLEDGNGEMYFPTEEWRKEAKKKAHTLSQKYNSLTEYQSDERKKVLIDLFGELKDGVNFNAPITIHYGIHTKIGKNCFFNFNFTCQDDTYVYIGDNCDFGPNVTIVTPLHPMLSSERKALRCPDGSEKRLCYAKPVVIGDGCWICAGTTICPGVTIGKDCVIGAGSVVIDSIPDGCFAAGNPCRVIRKLGEADSMKNKPEILGDCKVID